MEATSLSVSAGSWRVSTTWIGGMVIPLFEPVGRVAPILQTSRNNVVVRESRSNDDLRFGGVAGLNGRFEGFRLELTIALQQNFYLSFGLFQFLATRTRELHAFVK